MSTRRRASTVARAARLRGAWYFRDARSPEPPLVWGRPVAMFGGGMLVLGTGIEVWSRAARVEIIVDDDAVLELGDRVVLQDGCSIGVSERVTIGAGTRIGTHAQIMDGAYHRLEPDQRDLPAPPKPISIGSGVWIGAMSVILPGVEIGDGAVIRPRSVVTRHVPAGATASGLPATIEAAATDLRRAVPNAGEPDVDHE